MLLLKSGVNALLGVPTAAPNNTSGRKTAVAVVGPPTAAVQRMYQRKSECWRYIVVDVSLKKHARQSEVRDVHIIRTYRSAVMPIVARG